MDLSSINQNNVKRIRHNTDFMTQVMSTDVHGETNTSQQLPDNCGGHKYIKNYFKIYFYGQWNDKIYTISYIKRTLNETFEPLNNKK